MPDRIPGKMAETVIRLFSRGEAFDSVGFADFFTDTPMYHFGNYDPCLTKQAIIASTDAFFGFVAALYHDIRNLWEVGDAVFVEMDVKYWRKDGTSVTLPCADIFRFEGDKVSELRIYMDSAPIGTKAPIPELVSVMTVAEGEKVTSPGYLRKFFAEHPEGIERIKNGYAPKWSIAGPKWPTKEASASAS